MSAPPSRRALLIGISATAACRTVPASPPEPPIRMAPAPVPPAGPWQPLFDGSTLTGWQSTSFGGEGDVKVRDNSVVLEQGEGLTGIHWKGAPLPTAGYEVEVEAKRVQGDDFFCGLTFPVGGSHASLIVGGWHGPVVGISSLDGRDASENETKRLMSFERGQWYRVRVRVTDLRIEAWIDEAQVVGVETRGREIGVRTEMLVSRPLGLATWRTTAALRGIRLRRVPG